jgi:uncharacterized alpha-E superfamily protein
MLSRTAANLYWLGRYCERADFTGRLIQATLRFDALPAAVNMLATPWESALAAAMTREAFKATGQPPTPANVTDWLCHSAANPSSIRSCIDAARTNARAVRTALTIEAWETINQAWLEMHRRQRSRDAGDTLQQIDWLKSVLRELDGALNRTMLRDDNFWFVRLGAAVERADNSARLLDVKYHLLLPSGERVGGGLDQMQWTTILHAVSAVTAYRWIYREGLKPWLVADLLILQARMPRSLAACLDETVALLDRLGKSSGRRGPADREARALQKLLNSTSIDRIFAGGLHEFLNDFVRRNNALGGAIAEQFLF